MTNNNEPEVYLAFVCMWKENHDLEGFHFLGVYLSESDAITFCYRMNDFVREYKQAKEDGASEEQLALITDKASLYYPDFAHEIKLNNRLYYAHSAQPFKL